MSVYALVQDSAIVNTVIASPEDFQDPNYTWVDITNLDPQPSIGWTTDDNINFSPPALQASPGGGAGGADPVPKQYASFIVDNLDTNTINSLAQELGSVVFNTDINKLQYFNGQAWISLG